VLGLSVASAVTAALVFLTRSRPVAGPALP